MTGLPLIAGYALDGVLGVRGARELTAGQFVASACALAERLPTGACALLLCQDRLAFALGLAAMALRGTTALLPSSHAPQAVARIVRARGATFAVVDPDSEAFGLHAVAVDPWRAAVVEQRVPTIPAAQVAAIVHTSGTTGVPQAHPKTWSSLVRGAAGLRARVGFRAGDALVGAVPPQHMWGLEASVMLPLQSGGAIHPGAPLLPHDIVAALQETPSRRWLVLTPLHIHACLRASARLPELAGALTATSTLDRALAERFERATGAPTVEIYGSTETGVVATRRTALDERFEPLAGIVVEPLDGGVRVRGAHLETDALLGDHAVGVADGRFVLTGRDADLVKVAGKRASLAMLDAELRDIDGVLDGAFVVTEGGTTPRLAALVVAPTVDVATIARALRERIDPVFLPRPLHRVDALPRNALGKVPIDALRRRVAELSRGGGARFGAVQRDTHVRELVVPSSHPALPGHFPGRPVVPAAWLLTLIASACAEAFDDAAVPVGLEHARFRAPLAPDTRVRVEMRRTARGRIMFACIAGDGVRIADGVLAFRGSRR